MILLIIDVCTPDISSVTITLERTKISLSSKKMGILLSPTPITTKFSPDRSNVTGLDSSLKSYAHDYVSVNAADEKNKTKIVRTNFIIPYNIKLY